MRATVSSSLRSTILGAALLVASLVAIGPASAAGETPFLRGDVNNDGVVSLSDAHYLLSFLFRGAAEVTCGDAADVDNDGSFDISDAIQLFVIASGAPEVPAAPYPEPGIDDGYDADIDQRWPCDTYGGSMPVEDPDAALRVLDTVIAGGTARRAVVTLALSNSTRVAGYTARIDAGGIFEPRDLDGRRVVTSGVFDLSGTLVDGGLSAHIPEASGELQVGFLGSFVGNIALPPRDDQLVTEVHLCVRPGTPAGQYPLELVAGELVDFESGQRIEPELLSGTLTILEDVGDSECVIEDSDPREKMPLRVTFALEETAGSPGQEVAMPLLVEASDHVRTQGLDFSIDFDEEALELLAVETALERPDGEPWVRQNLWIDNENATPGSAGVDEGYATGNYYYGSWGVPEDQTVFFPVDEEFTALLLRFRVREGAEPGETEVRFVDGAEHCRSYRWGPTCWEWGNRILSDQASLAPARVDSFVLVNGRVKIIPDVTIFLRGDSNGDGEVDLSDARKTLDYLYLGGPPPVCFDAADANDDGRVDISDPIRTLQALFLGGGPLPAPSVTAGEDPTPDRITCAALGAF